MTDTRTPSARQTATHLREVVTRLSLSLEAVDTKDKFSCVPGVGTTMRREFGDKHLVGHVTARNPKHQPSKKVFVAAPAAILVAMSREATRLAAQDKGAVEDTLWFTEGEIRALAAPLCEEDLSHRGDQIVLGDVDNFGWGSMSHLLNANKFGCVKSKDLDEKTTIAKLEKLGKRPVCSSPGCNAYATKSVRELSDRIKIDTFGRSVYCKEHYVEIACGVDKRKKAGKGKGKGNLSSKAYDPVVLDDFDLLPSLGEDVKFTGAWKEVEMHNSYSSSASSSSSKTGPIVGAGGASGGGGGVGKIKASWYRRLLGDALLAMEVDRVEATKGVGQSHGLTASWRKEFAKKASTLYALTSNGRYVADKLEMALASSGAADKSNGTSSTTATATATASPILNRTSYASCSERDGGGGGGTAASLRTGHSPLAPVRAHGAAKPGVRLLIDNREKRGVTGDSQISELTSFLNSHRVPYEVREWKVGDYGWVVQPDAGNRPAAGEVGYEREFVIPRLLERKRVDDLAESMKDGRLGRQKKAMLRARGEGVVSQFEIHVEGGTQDGRFTDEIYRRGLTPDDLDAALEQSARQGFKIVHHGNFVQFSRYLAKATTDLQQKFDDGTLEYNNLCTWQNFVRISKGQIPLTQTGAAAEMAAAAAKAARAGRRGRPPAAATAGRGSSDRGRGRPPLPAASSAAAVGSGLRQRTLDGAFGVAGRSKAAGAQGAVAVHASGASGGAGGQPVAGTAGGSANDVINIDDDDKHHYHDNDDGDDDDVVEVFGGAARPPGAGAGAAAGGSGTTAFSSTLRGVGGSDGSRSGGNGRGKRKAVGELGSPPFAITAAGGYSPAPIAKIRRVASPAVSSLSKPAALATASSRGITPGDEDTHSPPPRGGTVDAYEGGARSGCAGRNSSRGSKRGSKRPRPADDCGGSIGRGDPRADRGGAPSIDGGSDGHRVGVKARSLSFADNHVEEEVEDGGGKNSARGTGGDGSGARGGRSGLSSFPRDKPSAPASSCPGGAGVVDLSADSPSPPPPPRPRQQVDVGARPPMQERRGQRRHQEAGDGRIRGGGGRGTDSVELEACSSDDGFTLY
eukprot:g7913.t1